MGKYENKAHIWRFRRFLSVGGIVDRYIIWDVNTGVSVASVGVGALRVDALRSEVVTGRKVGKLKIKKSRREMNMVLSAPAFGGCPLPSLRCRLCASMAGKQELCLVVRLEVRIFAVLFPPLGGRLLSGRSPLLFHQCSPK